MSLNLIWIIITLLFTFLTSAIFAGGLKLPRNLYLLIYIPLGLTVFNLFVFTTVLDIIKHLIYNCYWGLAGAAIAAVIVIKNVLSQPASKSNTGILLIRDIIWSGFLFGLVDSLLLSVLPILAVKQELINVEWAGNFLVGFIALTVSSVITAVYHLGYPEFRNKTVLWTVFGNGVLSLAFIVTMNPLAAIIPHIAMHIAAIIHGPKTTGQVPPHYKEKENQQ
ncbi:MAG: hypothetical protein KDC64_09420 [Aequorivita sp.]|nr:hypothetical protein [Aequorivita sp.]